MARWVAALVLALACGAADLGARRVAAGVREVLRLRHELMVSPAAVKEEWCAAGGVGAKPPQEGIPFFFFCTTQVLARPSSGAARSICAVAADPAGVEPARRYAVELACTLRVAGMVRRLPRLEARVVR